MSSRNISPADARASKPASLPTPTSSGNASSNASGAGAVAGGGGSSAVNEAELFRRAQAGDRGAFGQLAIRTQDRLFTALLRVVGNRDEARELTQETYVKALGAMANFRGQSQPYTWLFRIGVNLAISQLRKDTRRRTFSLDTARATRAGEDQASGLVDRLAKDQPGPGEALERREVQQQVLRALSTLDPEARAILVLRDIDGLDYQQMAETFEVPLGTLKSRLFRARLALREALEETGAKETGVRSQESGERRGETP